jgi:hypothetical protein
MRRPAVQNQGVVEASRAGMAATVVSVPVGLKPFCAINFVLDGEHAVKAAWPFAAD